MQSIIKEKIKQLKSSSISKIPIDNSLIDDSLISYVNSPRSLNILNEDTDVNKCNPAQAIENFSCENITDMNSTPMYIKPMYQDIQFKCSNLKKYHQPPSNKYDPEDNKDNQSQEIHETINNNSNDQPIKRSTNKTATNKEAANKEATNKDATNKETTNKETTNKEATNKEATNKESHNPESHNPESHNPESHNPQSHNPQSHNPQSHNQESQNQGSRNQESHNQGSRNQESHNQESHNQESHNQESRNQDKSKIRKPTIKGKGNLAKRLIRKSIIDGTTRTSESLVEDTMNGDIILTEPIVYRRNCLWITPMPASAFKDNYTTIPKPKLMKSYD